MHGEGQAVVLLFICWGVTAMKRLRVCEREERQTNIVVAQNCHELPLLRLSWTRHRHHHCHAR